MTQHGFEAQLRMYTQSLFGKTEWDWPVSVDDWRQRAREILADGPWGYLEGGAGAESTMVDNRAAFTQWKIRSRMLRDVADRDLTLRLFGQTYPLPFLLRRLAFNPSSIQMRSWPPPVPPRPPACPSC